MRWTFPTVKTKYWIVPTYIRATITRAGRKEVEKWLRQGQTDAKEWCALCHVCQLSRWKSLFVWLRIFCLGNPRLSRANKQILHLRGHAVHQIKDFRASRQLRWLKEEVGRADT